MNVQLIAADMDGTLLDPYGIITEANVNAIRCLESRGVEFLICSGRDYHDAKALMESYGLRCGYICLSGAEIYDREGAKLAEVPLTDQNISDIRHVFEKHHADMDILSGRGRFTTEKRRKKLRNLCKFYLGGQSLPKIIPKEILKRALDRADSVHFIDTLDEALTGGNVLHKIIGNNLPEDTVTALKEEFRSYPDLAAASSFPTNVELTNIRAQKGPALKAYASLRGIPLEAVMTLGDSDNDLSMFTPEFGWTVAMANAMDCIRQAAKYHTKSNREDGVACAIEQYILCPAQ